MMVVNKQSVIMTSCSILNDPSSSGKLIFWILKMYSIISFSNDCKPFIHFILDAASSGIRLWVYTVPPAIAVSDTIRILMYLTKYAERVDIDVQFPSLPVGHGATKSELRSRLRRPAERWRLDSSTISLILASLLCLPTLLSYLFDITNSSSHLSTLRLHQSYLLILDNYVRTNRWASFMSQLWVAFAFT